MSTNLTEKDINAIHDVLVRQLDVPRDQIVPEARIMGDLGADSLDVVEIAMLLEEHFGLAIPDERWEKVQTVDELCEAVGTLLQEAGTRP